jgi:hypothetical protein
VQHRVPGNKTALGPPLVHFEDGDRLLESVRRDVRA